MMERDQKCVCRKTIVLESGLNTWRNVGTRITKRFNGARNLEVLFSLFEVMPFSLWFGI
jgi:hypothetical protein